MHFAPNFFGYYTIVATAITFIALLKLPSRMSPIDNLGGSLVAALCAGWLIWPAAVCAAWKARKHAHR